MSPDTAAIAPETASITNTMFGAAPSIPAQAPPHTVAVTIIRPGLSKAILGDAPVFYTEEALRDSVPLWNGATCFCDHWPKSVRNIVGVFFDPYYEDGVKAKLRLTDPATFEFVNQIIADAAQGLPVPDVGLSADVGITYSRVDDRVEVTGITSAISADMVFAPAAGGSFDRVLNSLGDKIPPSPEELAEKRIRDLQSANDKLRAQLQNQDASLQEAVQAYRAAILEANPLILPEMVDGATLADIQASLKNAQKLVERVRENIEPPPKGTPPEIPAGAPGRVEPDLSTLSPDELIRRGLEKRRT